MDDAPPPVDMALDAGLNLWIARKCDPVNPVSKETGGRSEGILGARVLKSRPPAMNWVLATKVRWPNPGWTRDGAGYDGTDIEGNDCASLARLKTDVIDTVSAALAGPGHVSFRMNWA